MTNRTDLRAEELARRFRGEAVPYDLFRKRLLEVDIVLSCTGARHYVVDRDDVRQALKLRKNRPMFFIDLAVPRDVDPAVGQLPNAYVYDIDDLQAVVERNLHCRKEEIARAEEIIRAELAQVRKWTRCQSLTPTVRALVEKVEQIRSRELQRTLPRLKDLQEEDKRLIEVMTRSMVSKILHDPLTKLKSQASPENQRIFLEVVRELFGIDEGEDAKD